MSLAEQIMITHDEFRTAMLKRFPDAQPYVADDMNDGLLHLETASFRRYTQSLIDSADFDQVGAVFAFLEDVAALAHPDVLNAIYVSFLENFDFDASDNDRTAKGLLPDGLRKMLAELDRHWEDVGRWTAEQQGDSQQPPAR